MIRKIVFLILGFVLACCFARQANAQQIVINEILASNSAVNFDEDGDASDWLELYNRDTVRVDLGGYTLTDAAKDPQKWTLPNISIGPGEFLLIWASKKDRQTPGNLHTNFKFSAGGEFAGLYDTTGAPVDTFSFGPQSVDISYGRYPDGSASFELFQTPTPAAANVSGNSQFFEVTFSQPQGEYSQAISLEMQATPEGSRIRYTLDGSEPTSASPEYSAPITISNITVVRARVFENGSARGKIASATYIVGDHPKLPILTLVTDPKNLWDDLIGIYVNFLPKGRSWERPVQVSLIENGQESRFSLPAGIRIHGNSSRYTDKKNFRLYFRSEYGQSWLNYPVFKQKSIDKFKRLVLYAPSGDQPTGSEGFTLLHDALTHDLYLEMGGNASAFRPVSLYLNDEYWGIYWIMEYIDDNYVQSNLGITDMDLQRVKWASSDPDVRAGDAVFWNETYNYFTQNHLADSSKFAFAAERYLEVADFTDYHIINIFAANWDWPHNNLDRVRDRVGNDPRWRHIMWDTGAAWRYPRDHRTLVWATRDQVRTDLNVSDSESLLWSTLMLRRMLENPAYRTQFINRFADLMNTVLLGQHIRERYEALADWIRPEIPNEQSRWGVTDPNRWEGNLNIIRNFISGRPTNVRLQIVDYFNLPGEFFLTLQAPQGQGSIKLNSIVPDSLPWTGRYFQGVPVRLQAIPTPGYEFERWTDANLPNVATIVTTRFADYAIGAIFKAIQPPPQAIISVRIDSIGSSAARIAWQTNLPAISTIEFGPDSTLGNRAADSSFALDHVLWLQGLQDSSRYFFRILANQAGDSLITAFDSTFTTLAERNPPEISEVTLASVATDSAVLSWTTSEPTQGWVEFGPDSTFGQTTPVDSVYRSTHRQTLAPLTANTRYFARILARDRRGNSGTYATIQFTTPEDSVKSAIGDHYRNALPQEFAVSANYPNPFNPETRFEIALPEAGTLRIKVFDMNGRQVKTLANRIAKPGYEKITWDGRDGFGNPVSSGVYLFRVSFTGNSGKERAHTFRGVLLK